MLSVMLYTNESCRCYRNNHELEPNVGFDQKPLIFHVSSTRTICCYMFYNEVITCTQLCAHSSNVAKRNQLINMSMGVI